MLELRSIKQLVFLVGLLVGGDYYSNASPPPTASEKPPNNPQSTIEIPLRKQKEVRWSLDKNFAETGVTTKSSDGKQSYLAVRAVDVTQLDQTQRRSIDAKSPFAVWSKKFDDPSLKAQNGYASVVDEKVFTDCRCVYGRSAKKLDRNGLVIGCVKLKNYDPVDLVEFLISSGIVNANLHFDATVSCAHFMSDVGHWFSLHSHNVYFTDRMNIEEYDFGIHIAPDGAIRLINASDIGRLVKANDK